MGRIRIINGARGIHQEHIIIVIVGSRDNSHARSKQRGTKLAVVVNAIAGEIRDFAQLLPLASQLRCRVPCDGIPIGLPNVASDIGAYADDIVGTNRSTGGEVAVTLRKASKAGRSVEAGLEVVVAVTGHHDGLSVVTSLDNERQTIVGIVHQDTLAP